MTVVSDLNHLFHAFSTREDSFITCLQANLKDRLRQKQVILITCFWRRQLGDTFWKDWKEVRGIIPRSPELHKETENA